MPISFDKIKKDAPGLVNLYKDADTAVTASGITGTAKVALVLDYSLSMKPLYQTGFVQKIAEKLLALGLRFDDDGDIEVFLFDDHAVYAGSLTMNDYIGGINRLTGPRRMGSTNYADAINTVTGHYTGGRRRFGLGKTNTLKEPVYVAFFTDGDPNSESAAEKALRDASDKGVFFQFIGLGDRTFEFLERLDTLTGRALDNAGFFAVSPTEMNSPTASDEVLYGYMLQEFAQWIPAARAKGYIG